MSSVGKCEGIFKEYLRQFCDKNGKQLPNLPRNSMRGLAKLKKRVDDGTCVIMETDKTGRFAIVSIEAFLEMGAVHTENDLEIDHKDVDDRERHLNGHVSMPLKITEMGKDWRHQDRFRESNIKHSGFVAYLSLLVNDHKRVKEGQPFPTRPVVAANEGIGASLSNILSEMLDPLADSLTDKMEIISTEDGISRYKDCNKRRSGHRRTLWG